jgi:hypothetical protein
MRYRVIARSEATKQSSCDAIVWIASPSARNDGEAVELERGVSKDGRTTMEQETT